jgi:hypothetical protein
MSRDTVLVALVATGISCFNDCHDLNAPGSELARTKVCTGKVETVQSTWVPELLLVSLIAIISRMQAGHFRNLRFAHQCHSLGPNVSPSATVFRYAVML